MEQNGIKELSNALPDDEDLPIIHVEICQHPTRYVGNKQVTSYFSSFSVANTESVARFGAKVVAQLQGRYIMDEVTMTEFEDPQIQEHVSMVTVSYVESKSAVDHVSCFYVLCTCAIYFSPHFVVAEVFRHSICLSCLSAARRQSSV